MKTRKNLKEAIRSFSKLKIGWGGDNENEITFPSIQTACKIIDSLSPDVEAEDINVFPMRDGGVQIDVGEFKEIEVFNHTVTQMHFDKDGNIVNEFVYEHER